MTGLFTFSSSVVRTNRITISNTSLKTGVLLFPSTEGDMTGPQKHSSGTVVSCNPIIQHLVSCNQCENLNLIKCDLANCD